MIAAGGALFHFVGSNSGPRRGPSESASDIRYGLTEAEASIGFGKPAHPAGWTLYEISDFTCPACREAWPATRAAAHAAAPRFSLILFLCPLAGHPHAVEAARAAIAAADQGKFWQACDILFAADPQVLSHIEELIPPRIGVDTARFLRDLRSAETSKRLGQSIGLCKRYRVKAVPTMVLVGPGGGAIAVNSPDEAVRIVEDAG